MRITGIIWKEAVIARLMDKHGVSTAEAGEVLRANPVVRRMNNGHVRDEDVYAAMAHYAKHR